MSNERNTSVVHQKTILDALLALSLMLVTASCGHEKSAQHVHAEFHSARNSGGQQQAWKLLTASQQSRIRAEHIPPNPEEIDAATLSYATKMNTSSGELTFELHDGVWQVTSILPSYRRQDTPAHTLQTFERAVRVGDWATILELAPPSRRNGMTTEVIAERMQQGTFRQRTAKALRALRQAEPRLDGDARIRFSKGPHAAVLIRISDTAANARWYIDDLR